MKLITGGVLVFAVAVFLWMVFLGPYRFCDRLTQQMANARTNAAAHEIRRIGQMKKCFIKPSFDPHPPPPGLPSPPKPPSPRP